MRRLVLLVACALVILLLALAQLILPGIAAQQLRDRLSRNGTVSSVHVHAFPAVELLWHHADRVEVRMTSYRGSSANLGSSLSQAGAAGILDASASRMTVGLLTLRNATLHKSGDRFTGSAQVTEDDLRSAVPFLDGVQPVASGAGQLRLRGTATLLGVTATIDATVTASGGRLLVQPDVPFGALATLTLFSNPHLQIESLAARSSPIGFSVAATGRLR